MNKKVVLSASILVLLFLMVRMKSGLVVKANPIPVPALAMPEEYINATISSVNGEPWAKVNGTYPFSKIDPYEVMDNVTMRYPVPPDAEKISVKMNETSLDWSYSGENYATVIGDFPMINWTIKPVPSEFTINTYYEHPVPLIDGNYTFLYAMGTGRYLEYYAKNTTAYVAVDISKDVAYNRDDINVYTIGYNDTTGEWTWKPANYTITQKDQSWIITLTVVSDPFRPLEEDLLLTFTPPTENRRWAVIEDVNGDRLKVEASSDEIWSILVELYHNGSERWIGGIVEEYDNEWGFRFDPNTIIVEVVVIEVWQTTIRGISENLDYWLGEMACVGAKVVEINPETTIHVDPSITKVYVGDTFVIDVNITDAFDLYAFEFSLGYNTTFLDALNVVIPPPWEGGYEINDTGGYVWVWAFAPIGIPVSGSGTLASIIFNATAQGSCILDLYDTNLADSMGIPIPHNIIDGSVIVSPLIHDVAAISVTASPTKASLGELISINVTVENQGNYTETFNVSVYYTRVSDPLIGMQKITVAAGDNTTLTFQWTPNMTGRYEILAEASIVPSEVDTADNNLTTIIYVGYSGSNPENESVNGYHIAAFIFALFAVVMIIPEFRKNKKRSQLDRPAIIFGHNMPNNTTNMWQDWIRRQPL